MVKILITSEKKSGIRISYNLDAKSTYFHSEIKAKRNKYLFLDFIYLLGGTGNDEKIGDKCCLKSECAGRCDLVPRATQDWWILLTLKVV